MNFLLPKNAAGHISTFECIETILQKKFKKYPFESYQVFNFEAPLSLTS